jgi:hypothetical protein
MTYNELAPTMNAFGVNIARVKLIEVALWAADSQELGWLRVVTFGGHWGIPSL